MAKQIQSTDHAHQILGGDSEQMTTAGYVRSVLGEDPATNPDPMGAGWDDPEHAPWRLRVFPCGAWIEEASPGVFRLLLERDEYGPTTDMQSLVVALAKWVGEESGELDDDDEDLEDEA